MGSALAPFPGPVACADDKLPDAERLNREGHALFLESRFEEALSRFEAALFLAPDHPVIRGNVAEALAALGTRAAQAERWEEASRRFDRAVPLKPDDKRLLLWAARAHEKLDHPDRADAAYAKALDLDPKDPKALASYGAFLVAQDRLRDAVGVLERAAAAAPEDAGVKAMLEQARRDDGYEAGLAGSRVSLFDLAYDGVASADASQRVLAMLLEAQTEVGNDLGLVQRKPVRVILYAGRDYAEVTRMPEWAAAHYDGKIRLPIKALGTQEREVRASLVHEYVHALLHEHLKGCPCWLEEGLAQREEYVRVLGPEAEGAILSRLRKGTVVAFRDLEAPFVKLPADRVPAAYAQSLAFVRYLEARFGLSAFQVMLARWAEKPSRPWAEAFRDAFGSDPQELEAAWRETLP